MLSFRHVQLISDWKPISIYSINQCDTSPNFKFLVQLDVHSYKITYTYTLLKWLQNWWKLNKQLIVGDNHCEHTWPRLTVRLTSLNREPRDNGGLCHHLSVPSIAYWAECTCDGIALASLVPSATQKSHNCPAIIWLFLE